MIKKNVPMRLLNFLFFINIISFLGIGFSEPLVVLSYSKDETIQNSGAANFYDNENYSTSHRVKKNENLSKIINDYYGNGNFNLKFIQSAIVHKNKRAFVRSNPNYLFAGKSLYLPSVKEIKELVYKKNNKKNVQESEVKNQEIYFFGN